MTPIVHQNETRSPLAIRPAVSTIVSASRPVSLRHELRVEPADERREFVKALGVGVDEGPVDRALLDQEVREAVQEGQVGLGADREMKRGRHRRLGPARVDDDDLRVVRIPRDPLPEHRVGDAGVRPDQDDTVGLFKILVRVWWGVESERLLVGHDRRGHALPGVAVAVDHPHAELRDCPK